MTRVVAGLLSWILLFAASASPSFAQAQPRDGRLLITVVDQTRAVIPNADVTVTGLEDATKAATLAPVKTSDQGVATIAAVKPGRYIITAEFPGFEPGVLKDVRVRAGDNRQTIVLAIQGLQDSVTVGIDKQEASADRRGGSFGTALTRDQVDALSDDPTEMAQQLQDMAGGTGVIRVDSFEGGQLPPKAMIKSIHVTRDAFAAENHSAGGLFIDIITQPGLGPLRGSGRYNLRDGAFSGRSPYTPVKGPERSQNYGTNFAGTLIKDRASFNLSLNGSTSFETPSLYVATPGGTVSQAMSLQQPRNQANVYAVLDYALTKDQTLRFNYFQNDYTQHNLGIGGYDSADRAYSSEEHNHTLRVQEVGPLGRRAFVNTRLEFGWSDSANHSLFDAPTILVNGAFNNGGAQLAGGRDTHTFNLASDLDYVRSIHSVRMGVVFSGGSYRSTSTSNYLGTYTFTSLDAFEAGLPQSYTRRIGDPNIDYFNLQAGGYIQDDIRVRKGLTISPGLRYEAQTHLSDYNAFGPRIGVTWSPFKNGKTTLRASAGVFTDWLSSGTYEQTLQVDGVRQQELNIVNPSYPDPGNVGVVPPINKYLLAGDLQMARNVRVSSGVDYAFNPFSRVGVTYAHVTGSDLLRGDNLNTPVNGIRPNPAVGNLVEVLGDATSRQNTMNAFMQVSLTAPSMAPPKELWNWKRTNFGFNYTLGKSENNTDGAFAVPATGSLAAEWGPASNDIRHRLGFFFGAAWLRNFNANVNVNYNSGSPYTIRTGLDDNGDQIFNDRPAGIGRDTLRGAGSFNLGGFFVYNIPIGQKKLGPMPPGVMIQGGAGGNFNVTTMSADALPRFRMGIIVQAQNLTNHINYTGYSGIMTSPFFGQPTAAQQMRKIDVGLNFNF
ncbi:MAG TPA: TonB-dependent receptor [Vicinamibacterales bacterium]|nr:TonB-dependent receptor [Vicinamibacterales bacterium]